MAGVMSGNNSTAFTLANMAVRRPASAPDRTYCVESRKSYAYYGTTSTLTRTGVDLAVASPDVLDTGFGGVSRWVAEDYWQSTRVGKNANQAIASGAAVLVTLQTVAHDPFFAFDAANSRIFAITSGQYYVSAAMRWLAFTATGGHIYQMHIRVNGAIVLSSVVNPRSVGYWPHSLPAPLNLTAGDYVDLAAQQNSGAGQTVLGTTAQTFLGLHKI